MARKTQNADRDAKILADHERGIRARDLMEHYGLTHEAIWAIIRKQLTLKHRRQG